MYLMSFSHIIADVGTDINPMLLVPPKGEKICFFIVSVNLPLKPIFG